MTPRRVVLRARFRHRALLSAVLLGVAAQAAHATSGPPIKIRPLFAPRAAVVGEVFQGELEVTTDGSVELAKFALKGKGWSTLQLDAPSAAMPLSGDRLVLPFSVVPSDPSQPLFLDMEVDGQPFRQFLDLTPVGVARTRRVRTHSRPLTQPTPHLPTTDARFVRPGPAPDPPVVLLEGAPNARTPGAKESSPPKEDWQAQPQKARSIRVHGRFVYTRRDGLVQGVDGATVRVYDEDDPFSDLQLSSTTTDIDGYYDVTFTWDPCLTCDGQPDIYVEFEAANDHVAVETAFWEVNYVYETATVDDYTGNDLSFSEQFSSDESEEPALFILSTITRAWRWLHIMQGYDLQYTEVNWPDGDNGAWYVCFTEEMHISSGRQWNEASAIHEYGHHWMCNYGQHETPDYCNGNCDEDPDSIWPFSDCGHCIWCEETDHDAWDEGWSNWFADVVTRSFVDFYNVAALSPRSQETPQPCVDTVDNTPCDCDPVITEGWLGAVLRDIEDNLQDDHNGGAIGDDALSMGTNEIFAIADLHPVHTPMEFLIEFKLNYPNLKEDLWETARNSGYELDISAPAAPTGLASPSHPLFSTSTDATVQFTWTRAADDCSGIEGYATQISSGGPAMPGTTLALGDVTTWTSPVLAPGTYWFSIRSRDRAGRWGAGSTTYGPFTIRLPEDANLVYDLRPGWGSILVPRTAADATADDCPLPTALTGNATATYWNVAGENTGELATSGSFAVRLYIDGVFNSSSTQSAVGAGATFTRLNRGPVTVRGGRHTLETLLDGSEQIAETSETDNSWGYQWIWSPLALSAFVLQTRAAPPDRTAGWDAIGPGPALYYNCDGLRFSTGGWWNAVTVHADNDADDYDCRLHVPGTGAGQATGGFGANTAWSARAAGTLDAVLVNRRVSAATQWDVGVLNDDGGTSPYHALYARSFTHALDTRATVPLAQDEMILLREFYVPANEVGWFDLLVDVEPTEGPVHVLWLDETFATGDLLDDSAHATTDAAGHARLPANVTTDGYNCAVVYRDPKDGTGPIDVEIEITRTLPDYRPVHPPGWHASTVPRGDGGANPGAVPIPAVLTGNAAATWFNVASGNDSPVGGAIPLQGRIYLEDNTLAALPHGLMGPYDVDTIVNQGPYSIRGGRRSVVVRLDPDGLQPEISDANNGQGEQWVWSPLPLALDAPLARTAPPSRTGGFTQISSGEPLYYNCDGLRTPVFAPSGADGYWGAVAVMSGGASNVDLRLHTPSIGAKSGFASSLAQSSWGAGRSDFVLVNFNAVAFGAFDAGVVAASGSEAYTVQVTRSMHRGIDPHGSFGPYTIAAQEILDLHEAWLEPGVYVCRVENAAGTVDWGFSLHPSALPYIGKSTVVPGGAAWLNGAGQDEHSTVEIAQADYYAFAVWKVRSEDLGASGSYRLVIHGGATAAPPGAPAPFATALAGIHPNPFNPRTSIAFDLAQPGEAMVQIHTLRGELVATLVRRMLAAGRHEVTWDGSDAGGRAVASGIYLVRLRAGGREDTAKALLLK